VAAKDPTAAVEIDDYRMWSGGLWSIEAILKIAARSR
jgi:hypothetical protein